MFTVVHVGYNALTPEMTPDYDERSSLNGYRMAFSIAGTLGAIILATVLGWYINDQRILYAALGFILGLLSIIPPLIVYKVTKERPSDELPESLPINQALLATLRNHPFRLVMGLYLFSWTAASILAAVIIYYANYYLLVPDQSNYFVLLVMGSAILFIPLNVWLAQKFDKRRAFILGSAIWILVLSAIYFIKSDQLGLTYLMAFLAGFGVSTAYVIPWAMVPDIIEYDELKTGQRREGSYYAFASFFQKLATGLAIWGMGMILSMTGYITPILGAELPTQPEQAVQAIRVFTTFVPSLLLTAAIACAWFYPISREKHFEMREEISERET